MTSGKRSSVDESCCRYGTEQEVVEINEKDLAEKARQISITNLQPFFNSEIFKANNFSFDSTRKIVTQRL